MLEMNFVEFRCENTGNVINLLSTKKLWSKATSLNTQIENYISPETESAIKRTTNIIPTRRFSKLPQREEFNVDCC